MRPGALFGFGACAASAEDRLVTLSPRPSLHRPRSAAQAPARGGPRLTAVRHVAVCAYLADADPARSSIRSTVIYTHVTRKRITAIESPRCHPAPATVRGRRRHPYPGRCRWSRAGLAGVAGRAARPARSRRRTAKLGGHVDALAVVKYAYRTTPAAIATVRSARRSSASGGQDLLSPIHVVFTGELARWRATRNHGALFAAAAATLNRRRPAASRRCYVRRPGQHPGPWHPTVPPGFPAATIPVRVLSQRFAAIVSTSTAPLPADPARFRALCDQLRAKQWVVYAATLRRTRAGAQVSRPLHPSCRHRQLKDHGCQFGVSFRDMPVATATA